MKLFKTVIVVSIAITIFLIFAKLLIQNGKTNESYLWGLVSYLVLVNLYGFFIMLLDKAKSSRASRRRISERHLFIASAIGGSLGTLLGMKIGRHKTKHLQFTLLFPLILVIEGFAIYFFSK